MKRLTAVFSQECIDVLADRTNVELTMDQFLDLMNDNKDCISTLTEFGPHDTLEREMLMDLLAYKVGAGRWPMYGDSDEFSENFRTKFQEGIARLGYAEVDIKSVR